MKIASRCLWYDLFGALRGINLALSQFRSQCRSRAWRDFFTSSWTWRDSFSFGLSQIHHPLCMENWGGIVWSGMMSVSQTALPVSKISLEFNLSPDFIHPSCSWWTGHVRREHRVLFPLSLKTKVLVLLLLLNRAYSLWFLVRFLLQGSSALSLLVSRCISHGHDGSEWNIPEEGWVTLFWSFRKSPQKLCKKLKRKKKKHGPKGTAPSFLSVWVKSLSCCHTNEPANSDQSESSIRQGCSATPTLAQYINCDVILGGKAKTSHLRS